MIDFHTHIFSRHARDRRVQLVREDPVFSPIYSDKQAGMIGVEELLRAMEKEGVEASVVCGFPWQKPELCRRENDYLLDCHQRYSDKIFPFVSLPKTEKEGLSELERCAAGGALGIGELAPGTYGEELWDLEGMRPVFEAIREKSLPLLIHYNEPIGHFYPGKGKVGLHEMQNLLQSLQGLKVILAHMGGGFFFYELMPEIAAICQKVYYDTAASPFIYDKRVYPIAISIIGSQRILFGSDYPLIQPRRYVKDMREVGLGEEELGDILKLNAQRILGRLPQAKYLSDT